jgi:hypothetical protein
MKRTQMNEPTITPIAPDGVASPTAHLFMWRGNGIVLMGTLDAGRWILARAWLQGDRLEYVRRFITEASGNAALARDEGLRALAWTETAS